MNANPEGAPDDDGAAVTPEDTTAKPARKRRASKPAEAEAALPVDAAGTPGAEAAPKPRRRRAAAVPAGDEAAGTLPPAAPLADMPAAVERAAPAPAEAPASHAPARDDEPAEAVAGDRDSVGAEAESGAEGDGGEGGPRESRRSRRNRRDRRRGEGRAEGEAVAGAAPDAGLKAGERFAEVLSGVFDAEGEEPAAEPESEVAADVAAEAPATEEPDEAHKRVLAPEPDAPKLQKVLAQSGIGSRRDLEDMITDGRITVNGEPAHIGQRVSFGDRIEVDGKPVRVRIVPPPPRLLAYHKPVGEVVTHDDPQQRPTVFRRLPRLQQGKWQSVGRLDINTEGLLLFTNSGELANQLMHPRFGVEREYAVRVLGALDDEAKGKLLAGVEIDGQTAAFKAIEEGGGDGANRWYRVVITEGRNREVRKLFDVVGLAVSRLIRIRYGSVVLPRGLKRGVWVDLDDNDVRAIRRLASGGGGQRDTRPNNAGDAGRQGGRNNKQQQRQGGRPNERRGPQGQGQQPPREPRESRDQRPADFDGDEDDFDPSRIPNPLEQTFDKRFVQNPRSRVGGRGFAHGGGGFGAGGSAPAPAPKKGGPKEPDPLQTSVGYIGGDAFHRKNRGGGRGGRGGGGYGGGGGGRGR